MGEKSVILKAEGIRKYFPVGRDGKTIHYLHALDDVSISVKCGEIFGIVGESGSGKSTLGRCLMGLYTPDAGQITFDGARTDQMSRAQKKELKKKIQMVFQNPFSSFDPSMTMGNTFAEVGRVHFPRAEQKKFLAKCDSLIEMMKLPADIKSKRPGELSGGQLQRCAILRALLLSPEFIVADEAVSALDVSVQARILNLLMELRDELGLTILFISHDLAVVERVCDTVAVLYLGSIMEAAKTEELYSHILHPYTQILMAAKPKNHPLEEKPKIEPVGEIPSAVDIPEGCRFAGRCPYAQEICRTTIPALREARPGHEVACHFPLSGE